MSEVRLTGLDGKNPNAFLAALGVLHVLADRAGEGDPEPRLGWVDEGTFLPVITGAPGRAALIDALVQDARRFHEEPAIERLRYQKGGGEARDLKPPSGLYAEYLKELLGDGGRPGPEGRRSLAFAGCFATDVALDNNGNTKPTALHFTAGQQEFLGMVRELVRGVRAEDFEEALFGPWRYDRPLPVLQWDSSVSRDYALRASDPSKDKKTGVPGADWLAFRGLPFLPVAPVGDRIETTGCTGVWKKGVFRWPIWRAPLSRAVVASVLVSPEVANVDQRRFGARGLTMVFESEIRRSDQGGYGSFAPARVAEPRGP